MQLFRRLSVFIGKNGWLYLGAVVATALATVCALATPLVVRMAVDSVLDSQPLAAPGFITGLFENMGGRAYFQQHLWLCGGFIVFISLAGGIFHFARGGLTALATENVSKKMKDDLYIHLQKLPYEYHVKAYAGDLIQRCTSDVETVRRFLNSDLLEMARVVFMVVFSISIMVRLQPLMTLAALAITPVLFIFSLYFYGKVKDFFLAADEKEGELQTALQENISGVRVVRAFGREAYELEKFDHISSEFRKLNYRVIKIMALFWSMSDMLCFLQMGIVLITGTLLAYRGIITVGTWIVFNSYITMLLWPVRQLGKILSQMSKTDVSLQRIEDILHTPLEEEDENGLTPDLSGDIVFDHVQFGYGQGEPVLKDISFTVKKGETVAFLGGVGSGKSSLMHLLLRLYDYEQGSITINGVELRDIQKQWLRKKIGIVLQEPFLFSKTVEGNLKMAGAGITMGDMVRATEIAAVHHVISGFENGYGTMVGERGVTLSGGQKQRLAIARTLLKGSAILLFDDSLSAVDTGTDAEIRKALKERQKGVTTFIVSQRITTLMEADRIFVMENGAITHQGTHGELIGQSGLYQKIWQLQTAWEEEAR